MSICEEISKYVAKTGGDYEIVVDRVKALSKAIEEADESVIVIAAGKGREKTQKRGTEYVTVPSDVEVTMQSLF
jgi:UDP-N-acetylmuramyl tripeptide synthase